MTEFFSYRLERPDDAAAIDDLHDAAFGPGRFARTAFRVREGATRDPALAFVAELDGRLVGSVWLTGVVIGPVPALLLGPLAVLTEHAGKGAGRALMRLSLDAARMLGHALVVLVGDAPYYGQFGFVRVAYKQIAFPGPVDPNRVLAAELQPGALVKAVGPITAAREKTMPTEQSIPLPARERGYHSGGGCFRR